MRRMRDNSRINIDIQEETSFTKDPYYAAESGLTNPGCISLYRRLLISLLLVYFNI